MLKFSFPASILIDTLDFLILISYVYSCTMKGSNGVSNLETFLVKELLRSTILKQSEDYF